MLLRIDPHAHLYDTYPVREWCDAAWRNLQLGPEVCGALIVVDRAGQDSLARLRREVPSFGVWNEAKVQPPDGVSEAGEVVWDGRRLAIIRGVQYVSVEKIEVLGLGVARSVPDGAPASELVDLIRREGGVACLPWSPGKWMGKRSRVVSNLMRAFSPGSLIFGDIAIRTTWGPFSLHLARARARRFAIANGSDPLPRAVDVREVGAFGVECEIDRMVGVEDLFADLIGPLLMQPDRFREWGRRNGLWRALSRFRSTL